MFLQALNPLTTSKLYIMSQGETTRSQAAISFNLVKKDSEIPKQRPDKRLRGGRRFDPRNTGNPSFSINSRQQR